MDANMRAANRLRLLEDNWPELPVILILWRVADDWPVEFISRTVGRLGFRPEEFLSGSLAWSDLLHPEDRPRILLECAEFIAEGRDHFTQHYRLITADGKIRTSKTAPA
jgi:PAS domain-containing protein